MHPRSVCSRCSCLSCLCPRGSLRSLCRRCIRSRTSSAALSELADVHNAEHDDQRDNDQIYHCFTADSALILKISHFIGRLFPKSITFAGGFSIDHFPNSFFLLFSKSRKISSVPLVKYCNTNRPILTLFFRFCSGRMPLVFRLFQYGPQFLRCKNIFFAAELTYDLDRFPFVCDLLHFFLSQ